MDGDEILISSPFSLVQPETHPESRVAADLHGHIISAIACQLTTFGRDRVNLNRAA
jgi:hypothetical protein